MYQIIGCPMHVGVSNDGLRSSIKEFKLNYPELDIQTVEVILKEEKGLANLKNKESVIATCEALAKVTNEIVAKGKKPLCIGGDHSLAMGSIAGAVKGSENTGLFWVDSHADINTDKTTVSGNIHGMPVSATIGFGDEDLCNIYGYKHKIKPQNVVLFGLRDVDPLEKDIIAEYNIKAFYYDDIVRKGLKESLLEVKEYLSGIDKLHISFDLDSINPDIIKGVTVPAKSGFTEADAEEIVDFALQNFDISSADIVEYNPKYDTDKETVRFLKVLTDKFLNK